VVVGTGPPTIGPTDPCKCRRPFHSSNPFPFKNKHNKREHTCMSLIKRWNWEHARQKEVKFDRTVGRINQRNPSLPKQKLSWVFKSRIVELVVASKQPGSKRHIDSLIE